MVDDGSAGGRPNRVARVVLEGYDMSASTSWFSDALGAEFEEGRVVDGHGRWLALRTPDPRRWRDGARHVRLALDDVEGLGQPAAEEWLGAPEL
jgi:hypothetical protein